MANRLHKRSFKTDMSLWALAGLALLAMPRAIIHDTKSLAFDSFLYIALAILPFIIYLAIAIFRLNKRPFYDFMVMGAFYGLFLVIVHQVLWNQVWDGKMPELHDNLENAFSPATESLIVRVAAMHSSLLVGLGVGAVFGGIAVIARKARARIS